MHIKSIKENPSKFRFSGELFARISCMYSPAASRPRICVALGGAGYRPRRCSVSARFTAVAATLETMRMHLKCVSSTFENKNVYLGDDEFQIRGNKIEVDSSCKTFFIPKNSHNTFTYIVQKD